MTYEQRLAKAGFVRGPIRKRYERWDDVDGKAVAEVGHDGHLLASPEALAAIGVVPDVWGSDSARPTWGRVHTRR